MQRPPRNPNAPLLGRTLGVRAFRAANVLFVLALLLPIVAAASIFGSINLQLWRALPSSDPLLAKIEGAREAHGVVSGDDPAALKRLFLRLEKIAAPAAEARGAQALHLVFHASGANASAGPSHVALDLSALGAAAVVVIADRRTLWRIGGAQGQRARLGFEGPFAFDLAGAPDGLLAGFRVASFGGGETASPRSYADFHAGKADRRLVCAALERWRRHFGVARENLYVWSATNAQRITVGPRAVTGDVPVDPDAAGAVSACGSLTRR